MIKDDPQRKIMNRALIGVGLVVFVLIVQGLIQYISQAHHAFPGFLIIALVCYIVLLIFCVILLTHVWGRVDKRRQRAIQGDRSLLAQEQPIPNQQALLLPATMRLRIKKRFILNLFVVPILIVLLIFAVITFINSNDRPFMLIFFGILFGIILLSFIVTFVVLSIQLKTRLIYGIEVTQEGLTTYFSGNPRTIRWNEAQLFAITGADKPRRPQMYELANSLTVARWIIPPRNTFYYSLEPELPYEEYVRQMHALLELIEAKTHLPLYDLREHKPGWYM
jgi:hypothetical protein